VAHELHTSRERRIGKYKILKPIHYILAILSFFCTLTIFAENKLAIINDPDGFTNIRSGQGKIFSVIDTINKDEFFYCDPKIQDEWIKVIAMKWKGSKQVEGYIHRSRIQFVENLDYKKQKKIIAQILNKQRILADNFRNAWINNDRIAYKTTREEVELYSEIKYSPILDVLPKYFCSTNDTDILQLFFSTIILDVLPKYFCSTNDTDILQLFFSTMWANKGSANEMPSFAIGECFICKTDIVIAQLKKIRNVEQKELIFDSIEWGLLNYFSVDEKEKSNNKEFSKLKIRLENERKNACR